MKRIFISEDEKKIVDAVFCNKPYKVILFGSRVSGKHKKFSDLDVCIKDSEQVALKESASLKHAFSESDLPYTVDIIDYHAIGEAFKKVIDRDGVLLSDVIAGGSE